MAVSWPTPDQKARINSLRFIKDRMDVRTPPTAFEAIKLIQALETLPNGTVTNGQVARLTELDTDIKALDPAWLPGDPTTLVDRQHASNKISQLQGRLDRLFAEANKDVDVLAVYSRGGREEVDEAELIFEQ